MTGARRHGGPRGGVVTILVLATASLLAGAGRAQGAGGPSDTSTPRTYGTKDETYLRIPAASFVPKNSLTAWAEVPGTNRRYSTTPQGAFEAGVSLPNGALVTSLALEFCDSNAGASDVSANLELFDNTGTFLSLLGQVFSTGAPGCGEVSQSFVTPHTVNNATEVITVYAVTASGDSTNSFVSVIVGYKLQISPAPAAATFADVPTSHPYFRAIEALAASGITGGCGGGNFCPGSNVTRGEMAAFLARALGLHWPF